MLRRELNGLVAAWNHRTGQPHGVTHAALRRECGGPAAAVATAEQLDEADRPDPRVGHAQVLLTARAPATLLPMSAETSQTLDRGLRVLAVLAGTPNGLTVTELAAAVGVNRTVVYRLVTTLEQHGLARRGTPRAGSTSGSVCWRWPAGWSRCSARSPTRCCARSPRTWA